MRVGQLLTTARNKQLRRINDGKDELTLPWPPSINTYWRRHGHIIHVSNAGKKYNKLVVAVVRGRKPFKGSMSVTINLYPPDKRRRDIDNSIKVLLDCLTKARVWLDDSQIEELHVYRCQRIVSGQVQVEIKEL